MFVTAGFMYAHTRRLLFVCNDECINRLVALCSWKITATYTQSGTKEEATPPGIDGLFKTPPILCDDALLSHASRLQLRLIRRHIPYKHSSQYVISILAKSIQDYRTIELLFKASSSSGLGANASLAS